MSSALGHFEKGAAQQNQRLFRDGIFVLTALLSSCRLKITPVPSDVTSTSSLEFRTHSDQVGKGCRKGFNQRGSFPLRISAQGLSYTPEQDEEEFEALPRGSFRVVSEERGGGVVDIGPASDESVVRVTVDAAGVIREIMVVPTVADAEGSDGGAQGGQGSEAFRSLPDALPSQRGGGGADTEADFGRAPQRPSLDGGGRRREGDLVEAHVIYPAKHHVAGRGELDEITSRISEEMEERCSQLGLEGKVLEAERLRQRTENDLLLLDAVGTCKVRRFCCCAPDKSSPGVPAILLFVRHSGTVRVSVDRTNH